MAHCNAYNCLEDSRKRSDKVNASSCTQPERRITFFSFPKDPVYRRLWVQNMRLENFVVKDHSRLCEKHFEDDQFDRRNLGRRNRVVKSKEKKILSFSQSFSLSLFAMSVPRSVVQRKDMGPIQNVRDWR